MSRHFPPPWREEKVAGGYVVRDANGQALVHIFARSSEGGGNASQNVDHGRGAAYRRQCGEAA
jgi:hypothetical protein